MRSIGFAATLEGRLNRRRRGNAEGPRSSSGEPYEKFVADLKSDNFALCALNALARRNVPTEPLTRGLFLALNYLRDETNLPLPALPSKRQAFKLAKQLESDANKVEALNKKVVNWCRRGVGITLWRDEGRKPPNRFIRWFGEKQEMDVMRKLPVSVAEALRAEAKFWRSLYQSFRPIRPLSSARWIEIGLLDFVIATSDSPHYREVAILLQWLFRRAGVANIEIGEEILRRRYRRNPTYQR